MAAVLNAFDQLLINKRVNWKVHKVQQ